MFFFFIFYICVICFFFYKLVFKFVFKKGDSFGSFGRINKFVFYESNLWLYIYIIFNVLIHFFFLFIHITEFYEYFYFIKLFESLNLVMCLMIMLFFEALLALCYHSYEFNKRFNISLISWNGFFYFFKLWILIMVNQSMVLFLLYTLFLLFFFGLMHNNRNYIYNVPKIKE